MLPVVLLVVTGIPLQFTDTLNLGSRGVESPWLHAHYGVVVPDRASVDQGVVQVGDLLLIDGRKVSVSADMLGAVSMEFGHLVATATELIMVPAEPGIPVERSALPAPGLALGASTGQNLALRSAEDYFRSDDLGATWRAVPEFATNWRAPQSVPVAQAWALQYGARLVTLERVLVDAHSGRIIGQVGVWIMNAAGFALIGLALTGAIVWLRSRAGREQRRG